MINNKQKIYTEVNKFIKRHRELQKINHNIMYRIGDKKYEVRKFIDLVRYDGIKYLELDEFDLNRDTNRKIITLKNEEILKLQLLGTPTYVNKFKTDYIIHWWDGEKTTTGQVGKLK